MVFVGAAAENRGRGRPRRLTATVADAIVARIAAGDSLASASAAAGVGARTLRAWRASAYSRAEPDRPFVELEKRIQRALASRVPIEPPPEPWEEVAARLELEFPDRWGLDPALDDFFDQPSAA
jgi:hypothetical protein